MTGSGTVGDPYLIYDVDDLQAVNNDLSAYYELANDIDASATIGWNAGAGFNPIGRNFPYFTGHFDGKEYTISDLFINRPAIDRIGLFGRTNGAVIQNVTISVDVTGRDYIGGLIGRARDTSITSCAISGSVGSTGGLVGGLVGYFRDATISQCHLSATVMSIGNYVGDATDIGGLIGYARGLTISYTYATGDVSAIGQYVGGLIGYTGRINTISYCFATGDVVSTLMIGAINNYIGGFIGITSTGGGGEKTTISNCYATGKVTSNKDGAGLIDTVFSIQDTVDNCYSTGEVNGVAGLTGGLVAVNNGTITNCFWDTETSGQATSDGGIGKTTAQMKNKSTFRIAGWDFMTIWSICSGINSNYPCLVGVTPSCSYVTARHHHPTHPTEPNRGKVLSKMGSL